MINKQKIMAHLEKYVGAKITMTKHFVSNDKSLEFDLAFFRANRGRPYHIVSTIGLSELKMTGKHKRVEFVIYLDKDWNLFSDKEEFSWVYSMLCRIAKGFYNAKRDMSYGQTYLTTGSNTFSPYTEMNSAILYCPVGIDRAGWKMKVGFNKKIDFFLITTATYREYAIIRRLGGLSFVDQYLLEDGDLEHLVIFNKKKD